MECRTETLDKFERAVDITIPKPELLNAEAAVGGPIHP